MAEPFSPPEVVKSAATVGAGPEPLVTRMPDPCWMFVISPPLSASSAAAQAVPFHLMTWPEDALFWLRSANRIVPLRILLLSTALLASKVLVTPPEVMENWPMLKVRPAPAV